MKLTSLTSCLATGLFVFTANVQAQINDDNWNDGNDTSPLAWQRFSYSGGNPGTWSFPINPADGTSAYQMSAVGAAALWSTLGNTPGTAVPDFVQTVDVIDWLTGSTIGSQFGLYGRLDTATLSGYGLQIRKPTSSTGQRLMITKFTGGAAVNIAEADFLTPLDPAPNDYKLVFSAYGSTLTGQIIDNATGLPVPMVGGLTSISITDTAYSTGKYGVGVVYINNTPQSATFDNYTMVPEPSALALAGLGLASLLIFRRRK